MARFLSIANRALTVLFGTALLAVSWAAPVTAVGAVIGVLFLRPWRAEFRERDWHIVVVAAVLGGLAGALVGGTEFGPAGPKAYANLFSRLLGSAIEAVFVGAVLVAGGLLRMRSGLRRHTRASAASEIERAGRRLGRTLGRLGHGVVHFFVAFVGSLMLLTSQTTDAFYVEGATLVEPALYYYSRPAGPPDDVRSPEWQEWKRFSVRGHRIMDGAGTVLAYRWYSPDSRSIIDDEDFEKLSIFLPGNLTGQAGTISLADSAVAVAAYTRGGSAWPTAACYGYPEAGTLRYRRWPFGRVRVEVTATIVATSGRSNCARPFRKVLILRRRELASLSAWLGGCAADHVYAETYRNIRRCESSGNWGSTVK